jgi:hypothetical protein
MGTPVQFWQEARDLVLHTRHLYCNSELSDKLHHQFPWSCTHISALILSVTPLKENFRRKRIACVSNIFIPLRLMDFKTVKQFDLRISAFWFVYWFVFHFVHCHFNGDFVNHETLLTKFYFLGIRGAMVYEFGFYLTKGNKLLI